MLKRKTRKLNLVRISLESLRERHSEESLMLSRLSLRQLLPLYQLYQIGSIFRCQLIKAIKSCLTTVFAKFRYTDLVLISWIWLLKCDLTLNRSINRLRRLINKDLNYFIQSINYPFSAYRILFRILMSCVISSVCRSLPFCCMTQWRSVGELTLVATPTEYLNNVSSFSSFCTFRLL